MNSAERTAAFQKSITEAPEDTKRIQLQAAENEPQTREQNLAALPESITSEQLQQTVTQEQAELANLRTKLADLEKRIQEEHDRPAKARARISEAKTLLDQVGKDLAATLPSAEPSELERAQLQILQARRAARMAEIQMLEHELLSNSVRVDLLTATRDFTITQIARLESQLKDYEARLSELRQAEAVRASREAEQLRREAIGKHRLVQQQAEEITQITKEIESIGPLIDQTRLGRVQFDGQLEQTKSDLEEVQRTLELRTITESVGAVLLEQRRAIQDPRTYRKSMEEMITKKSEVRLRLFKIDRQLKQLSDLSRALELLFTGSQDSPQKAVDRADLERELRRLLTTKKEHLNSLAQSYRAYFKELSQQESVHQELGTESAKLAEILDEHLLWIRNTVPLNTRMILNAPDALLSIPNTIPWNELSKSLQYDLSQHSPLYFFFGVTVACLIFSRRKLHRALHAMENCIGKVGKDDITLTVRALVMTALVAAPLAVVLEFTAWRIVATEPTQESAKALGVALAVFGAVYLIFRSISVLCSRSGVGELHFRWNPENLQLFRRHLFWFLPVAAGCGFLIAFTQAQTDPISQQSVGRLAFLTLMLSAIVLAYFLFHPQRGFKVKRRPASKDWLTRTRPLWLPASALVPAALATSAAMGYYYMALELEYRLNQTLLWILGALFSYAFLYRWLVISQRRLGLKVALEKREALNRNREAQDEDSPGDDLLEIHEQINVSEIKDQTVELLRFSIGLVLVAGLWFAWSSVLPALKVFGETEVWRYSTMIDGTPTRAAVTRSNIVLCAITVLVTFVTARNIPGFLEIALLQRLRLDAGTRHAARTLVLYGIVAIGVVMAFNFIGIGWSSVQWLIAALSVGLGFGLQEIFGNFVSGLIILLERPIRVGDTVTVGSISGVVTQIRMRATTITDWNRKELVVPNKSFITGELINWSLSDPILRLDCAVGIAYGSDTTLAHKVMLQVAKEHPLVLDQPEPNVFFLGFGDNSLNFEVRVFVSETANSARTRTIHDLHMAIDQACRKHNICIAFPQRDVHLDIGHPIEVHLKKDHVGALPSSDRQSPSRL